MLAHLVALLLQVSTPAATPPDAAALRRARADSVREARRRAQAARPPKRDSVTAQLLATAFDSPAARDILTLARRARTSQDSALQSYDATTYQRISAGLALTRLARERLAFRTESATRVQWRRGVGAYVDVTGSRSVVPIAGRSAQVDVDDNISPVPYHPGSETLWIGLSRASNEVDENQGLVHPLAVGAEAYFTYEAGDSVSFRLPGGRTIQLRELRVRPRRPRWNLAVGSLWFDMSGGQLVRAAYRMSTPMDIGEVARQDDSTEFDDVPVWVKPLLFPMTAQVSAVGVEYGLYQGRFWLPRLQVIEGSARVGPVRSPFKVEQRYDYSDVNAGAPLPPIPAATDSTRHDGGHGAVEIGDDMGGRAARDSMHARSRGRARCDSTGMRSYSSTGDTLNPVFVRIPCDSARLANSPDLPKSIYDTGDEAFQSEEMDALVSQALAMGAQARFAPQPVVTDVGRPRYNRIEGLSLGARADQLLGDGYSASAEGRVGLADREPNVELGVARSDLRRTLAFTAYNRLVSANDWGNPFGLGRSLNALIFSRDEGYYYRASGLELSSSPDQDNSYTWTLFAEQERTARVRTSFSLAHALGGAGFDTNLVARREPVAGARMRRAFALGTDPESFRLFGDARAEAAYGRESRGYGRVAADVTASRGIGNGAAALTVAGGTSAGDLPSQRFWFLGGSQTVRGQRPGVADGNAFWLARAEVAHGMGVVRPALFADMGWAGDREHWREVGQPLSGAGVGLTILDGLLRLDLARGINPVRQWRVETYLEARF